VAAVGSLRAWAEAARAYFGVAAATLRVDDEALALADQLERRLSRPGQASDAATRASLCDLLETWSSRQYSAYYDRSPLRGFAAALGRCARDGYGRVATSDPGRAAAAAGRRLALLEEEVERARRELSHRTLDYQERDERPDGRLLKELAAAAAQAQALRDAWRKRFPRATALSTPPFLPPAETEDLPPLASP